MLLLQYIKSIINVGHPDFMTVKVTVLLINNFVGAKVYCLKVALLLYVYFALNRLKRVCKTVNCLVVGYHSIF